jgi:hypothetical protein
MQRQRAATGVYVILLMLCGASPGLAAESWITNSYTGSYSDAEANSLAGWINDVCHPDEMSNITGFSFQTAPGAPFNLRVFCHAGGSGKLGQVKVVRLPFAGEYTFKTQHLGATQSAAIIGYDLAASGKLSGTVVMVIKQ